MKLNEISASGFYDFSCSKGNVYNFSFQINNGYMKLSQTNEKPFAMGTVMMELQGKWITVTDRNFSYDLFVDNMQISGDFNYQIRHAFKKGLKGNQEAEINTIIFFSRTLNKFYINRKNFSQVAKKLGAPFSVLEDGLFSLSLPTGKNVSVSIWLSFFPCFFEYMDEGDTNKVETPIVFRSEGNACLELNDIECLISFVNKFISFISFEEKKDISRIIVSNIVSLEEPFGMDDSLVTESVCHGSAFNRPIIKFERIKDNLNNLMQAIINGGINFSLIFPLRIDYIYSADIFRFCSAIENELGKNISINGDFKKLADEVKKKINYTELEIAIKKHAQGITNENYKNEFISSIGVLENFSTSLGRKLKFVLEKLLGFLQNFNDNSYPFDIEKICSRVKNFRHGQGHGLEEKKSKEVDKYKTWYSSDFKLLHLMVYMLILERVGVNTVNIGKILNEMYPHFLSFKQEYWTYSD